MKLNMYKILEFVAVVIFQLFILYEVFKQTITIELFIIVLLVVCTAKLLGYLVKKL